MKVRWFSVAVYLSAMTVMYFITSNVGYSAWSRIVAVLSGLFIAFVIVNTVDERG